MTDVSQAIVDLLRRMKATPEVPNSLYDIGVPLVDDGFSQNAILNGLYKLQSERIIELIDGNRLRLVKALPVSE